MWHLTVNRVSIIIIFYHFHSYFPSQTLLILGSLQYLVEVIPVLALFPISVLSIQQAEKILLKCKSDVTWSKPSKASQFTQKITKGLVIVYKALHNYLLPYYLISYLPFPYLLYFSNIGLSAIPRIFQAPSYVRPCELGDCPNLVCFFFLKATRLSLSPLQCFTQMLPS